MKIYVCTLNKTYCVNYVTLQYIQQQQKAVNFLSLYPLTLLYKATLQISVLIHSIVFHSFNLTLFYNLI